MWNKIKNAVENTYDDAKDGLEDLGETIKYGLGEGAEAFVGAMEDTKEAGEDVAFVVQNPDLVIEALYMAQTSSQA